MHCNCLMNDQLAKRIKTKSKNDWPKCFCLLFVSALSAGGSYVHPQEHMCENMHARTKLACAANVFLICKLAATSSG